MLSCFSIISYIQNLESFTGYCASILTCGVNIFNINKKLPEINKTIRVLVESEKHGFTKEQNQQKKAMLNKTFSAPPGNAMSITQDYGIWVNRHVMIAFTTMLWMAEVGIYRLRIFKLRKKLRMELSVARMYQLKLRISDLKPILTLQRIF